MALPRLISPSIPLPFLPSPLSRLPDRRVLGATSACSCGRQARRRRLRRRRLCGGHSRPHTTCTPSPSPPGTGVPSMCMRVWSALRWRRSSVAHQHACVHSCNCLCPYSRTSAARCRATRRGQAQVCCSSREGHSAKRRVCHRMCLVCSARKHEHPMLAATDSSLKTTGLGHDTARL